MIRIYYGWRTYSSLVRDLQFSSENILWGVQCTVLIQLHRMSSPCYWWLPGFFDIFVVVPQASRVWMRAMLPSLWFFTKHHKITLYNCIMCVHKSCWTFQISLLTRIQPGYGVHAHQKRSMVVALHIFMKRKYVMKQKVKILYTAS